MASTGSSAASSAVVKRFLDATVAGLGLLVALPVLLIIALAVMVDSPGPPLFDHIRVGRNGRRFRIHKFRTMRWAGDSPNALEVTAANDSRITRIGRWLRRSKLDEIPQLWNVLVGEMSLVGPRPEVPRYVAFYTEEDVRVVLSVRPGVTDPVSLALRNEQELLSNVEFPEEYYVRELLPQKLALSRQYVLSRSLRSDIEIIVMTILAICGYRSAKSQWTGAQMSRGDTSNLRD